MDFLKNLFSGPPTKDQFAKAVIAESRRAGDLHQELFEHAASAEVRNTITIAGIDPGAEPILREVRDESLRLIFAFSFGWRVKCLHIP